jgi:predicted DNA-binding mobile mystery protein A
MENRKLLIDQLDRKIARFPAESILWMPSVGWVHSIRIAIRMSLAQLGKRLNISAQSARDIEKRESNGTISVNALRRAAAALDMELVYGLVPRGGSIEKMIDAKAHKIAEQIVRRTSVNMRLEDQENSPLRLERAIKEKTEEIKQEMPRYLWD